MTRRITINDDEAGVEVSMTVAAQDGQTRITTLTLAALEGGGITADHLLMLEDLGLPLPHKAPPTPPRKAKAARPPAALPGQRAAEGGEATPTASPPSASPLSPDRATRAGGTQPYRRRPPNAEFANAYRRFAGNRAALAKHFKVPVPTIGSWLKTYRRQGVIPEASGQNQYTVKATAPPAQEGQTDGETTPTHDT